MPGRMYKTTLGSHTVPLDALPTVSACATHLRLLETFVALGEDVQSGARRDGVDPDAAWSAFVDHSVLRFFGWLRSTGDVTIKALPPLDILMVWHAFMLNPRTYASFCKRIPKVSGPFAEGIPWQLVTIHLDSGAVSEFHTQSKEPTSRVQWPAEQIEGQAANWLGTGTNDFALLLADAMKFDLAAAVHRQRRFAFKMARFGWVHSPVSDSILARAIDRYVKFLSLFADQQETTRDCTGNRRVGMVPTLDIDLIWHTHQLSPASYRAFTSDLTGGRMINHDDSISHGTIRSGFIATAQLYRDRFNEEYDICNSWFCQIAQLRQGHKTGDTAPPLSTRDLAVIQGIVDLCALNRRLQLGVSVNLDLASCQCQAYGAAEDASSTKSLFDRSASCGCDGTSGSSGTCNATNCSGE